MFYVSGSRRCSCCGRSTQRDEKAVLLQCDDRVLTAASKSSRGKINSRPTTLLNYYQREPERIEVNLVPRNVFSRIKTAAARKETHKFVGTSLSKDAVLQNGVLRQPGENKND